jgi:hypothetical protein
MNFTDWLYTYHFITSVDFDRLSENEQEILMNEYHSYFENMKRSDLGDLLETYSDL